MAAVDEPRKDSHTKDKPSPPGQLVIQVYDEDAGGPPFTVLGGPGEKVSKIVEVAYAKLQLTPTAEHRLTCLATGEDVRQYGDMHLREYAAGRCRDLVWTFVRDTGGAGA